MQDEMNGYDENESWKTVGVSELTDECINRIADAIVKRLKEVGREDEE